MKKGLYLVVEGLGEVVLGSAIGIVTSNAILPTCKNKIEKSLVFGGACIGSWMIGRAWNKATLKLYDHITKEDNSYTIKKL